MFKIPRTACFVVNRMVTHRPSAVAAHAPLCHHTFSSIDHQHLMLDGNLIFGLNGMFKVQNTKKTTKTYILLLIQAIKFIL